MATGWGEELSICSHSHLHCIEVSYPAPVRLDGGRKRENASLPRPFIMTAYSTTTQTTLSPTTSLPLVTREYPSSSAIPSLLAASHTAYLAWRLVPLAERMALLSRFIDHVVAQDKGGALSLEITEQMGRPIRYSAGEIKGFEERARWLVAHAPAALADENVDEGRPEGLKRTIRRAPVGVCLLVGAWNFPCASTSPARSNSLISRGQISFR